jgi:hypothetical protein
LPPLSPPPPLPIPSVETEYVQYVTSAYCESLRRGENLRSAQLAAASGFRRRFPGPTWLVTQNTPAGRALVVRINTSILRECGPLHRKAVADSWSF